MKIVPHNGCVLCKQLNESTHDVVSSGILYKKEELPVYEIVDITGLDTTKYSFTVGDMIISNSVPTKLKIGNEFLYLIKQDYIAGKVDNGN